MVTLADRSHMWHEHKGSIEENVIFDEIPPYNCCRLWYKERRHGSMLCSVVIFYNFMCVLWYKVSRYNIRVGVVVFFSRLLLPLGPRLESCLGMLCGVGFQSLPDCLGFPWNNSMGFSSHIIIIIITNSYIAVFTIIVSMRFTLVPWS